MPAFPAGIYRRESPTFFNKARKISFSVSVRADNSLDSACAICCSDWIHRASPCDVILIILTRLSPGSPKLSIRPFCSSLTIIPAAVDCATCMSCSICFRDICFSGESFNSISASTWAIVISLLRRALFALFSKAPWICLIRCPQLSLSTIVSAPFMEVILTDCDRKINSMLLK